MFSFGKGLLWWPVPWELARTICYKWILLLKKNVKNLWREKDSFLSTWCRQEAEWWPPATATVFEHMGVCLKTAECDCVCVCIHASCVSEWDRQRPRACLPLVSVELIIICHSGLETMCLFRAYGWLVRPRGLSLHSDNGTSRVSCFFFWKFDVLTQKSMQYAFIVGLLYLITLGLAKLS